MQYESAQGPDAGVIQALQQVRDRRPSLAPLIDRLGYSAGGVELSDAFLEAYHRSDDPHRSWVMRAVLADDSLFRRPLASTLTPTLARRFVRFLRSLPEQPLASGYCTRDQLPKSLRRWFGLTASQGWIDFADAMTEPLWEVATSGKARSIPAHAKDWPAETWEALLPLLNARHLTAEVARQALREGISTPFARYYFETVPPLAVRNLLVFLGELFATARQGGREQNLIPLQIARRFNIPARSVPDTLALLDVLVLVHDGIIRAGRNDPCGIGRLFEQPVPGSRRRFWEPAIRAHRTRWMLGPGYVHDESTGMFDSGLMFNMARALGLVPGSRSRMEAFAPYYRRIDRQALWEACFEEWAAISPSNLRRCRALLGFVEGQPAIRVRDLGNIVSLRTLHGPEAPLPQVARYALGKPEPEAESGPRPDAAGRPRQRRNAPPKPFRALEDLIRSLDAAVSGADRSP